MFLEGKEFKSIWNVAHLWAGHDPESTDPNALPDEVRDYIHWLIVGHFRGELPLRRKWFLVDILDDSVIFNFLCLSTWIKLRKCTFKNTFDKAFLDSLRIARGELIRWCQKEFRNPPPFWMPEGFLTPQKPVEIDDADDENDSWYNSLSDRRKQRVTNLEIANQLWKDNPELSYEQVRSHPTMTKYGFGASFSLGSFKKWARPFASDFAKRGGNKS